MFRQTYQDFEIVIVDDGSTDGSVDVIKENFDDPRIRIISQENAGVSASRNRGIAEAKYDYIALLDADDEWKPEYLETQYNLIKKYPDCSVFVTNYEFHNERGEVTATKINKLPFNEQAGVLSNYFQVAACSHPPLWTSAIVIKKDSLKSVGGFPVGVKSGEDLLTWARLACRYKIAYAKTPLSIFNIEESHIKSKPKREPAEKDIVGEKLMELKKSFNPPHIDNYISLWHKMRSSIYMRLGKKGKSIKEAIMGLRYNPSNYKLIAYIIINLIPFRR